MLTFRFVTPRWTDPAEASDATLTAASNAANARSSLPRFIALPHYISDDGEIAPGSIAILDDSRRVERTELGQETAGRLAGLADKRDIVHARLPDRCRRRPAELQDSGRVVRAVLSDGRAGAAADHEHAGHVELAALVQHDRRAPSDTMVLMSAVCAPADPAPMQHKVRNAPQAAPEKCLMTCLATENGFAITESAAKSSSRSGFRAVRRPPRCSHRSDRSGSNWSHRPGRVTRCWTPSR